MGEELEALPQDQTPCTASVETAIAPSRPASQEER